MELNNIFFTFVLVIFGFLLNKYILKIFYHSKFNLLADIDYKKPQSFHQKSTFRLGGITIFLSLILFYLILLIVEKEIKPQYLHYPHRLITFRYHHYLLLQ